MVHNWVECLISLQESMFDLVKGVLLLTKLLFMEKFKYAVDWNYEVDKSYTDQYYRLCSYSISHTRVKNHFTCGFHY